MSNQNHHVNYHSERERLVAYYIVQQKLLGLYNQDIDVELRLKEMFPTMMAVMSKRGKGCLKSLERMTLETTKKFASLEKENPRVAQSEDAKRLTNSLGKIWAEYCELL